MRKLLLFVLSILFAYTIAYYGKHSNQIAEGPTFPGQWETYGLNKQKEISKRVSTDEELHRARIRPALHQNNKGPDHLKRAPSSVPDYSPYPMRDGRILVGDFREEHKDSKFRIKLVNQYNSKWKERAAMDLVRFQDDTVKVLIKEEQSILEISENSGRLYEQAQVTYLNADGSTSSFKALIDSESGLVIRTWDRTIREDAVKTRENLGFPLAQDIITN